MGNTDTRTEAQNVEDSDESTSLLNQEESISKYISENSTSSCGPSPGCTAFLCGICLCQEDVRQAFTLPLCKHQFCRSCLSAYLTSQINDGHTDIRCPAVEGEANLRYPSFCSLSLPDHIRLYANQHQVTGSEAYMHPSVGTSWHADDSSPLWRPRDCRGYVANVLPYCWDRARPDPAADMRPLALLPNPDTTGEAS